ncbi:MAG: glucose-1-phosphate cytidylyltransferase [Patescibacteria group bacterium]|jgi:glucose-1-phosphate cytidylyltransferase
MKVIILAGGFGTRLGDMTREIPKPMALIGDKPIIWHIMKIYSHYGYDDFILSLGYKHQVIKEFFCHYDTHTNDFAVNLGTNKIENLNTHNEVNWRVMLVNTGLNTLKGARIKRLEKYLDDDLTMCTYGDGVADINIKALVEFHKSQGKMVTITGVRPPSRFGEITTDGDKVLSFSEKPQSSTGLINGGFIIFDKRLLGYLSEDENCDLEYGAFEKIAKEGELMVYRHTGQWECVDTERDFKHLNKIWEANEAFWKVWK